MTEPKIRGWLPESKGDDWRDTDQAAVRVDDVAREIADDPVSIVIQRAGSPLAEQTVRLLPHRRMERGDASDGGQSGVGELMVLGTSSFDVQYGDRFLVSGSMYEVLYVAPAQVGRVEARVRQVQ